MSELTERLEAARIAKGGDDGGWSRREIARKVGISSPTVDRMFNGRGKPKVKNLDAVAEVLGIPIAQARKLAGLPVGASGPYEGPEESELLDERQRRALDELIRSIVHAKSSNDPERTDRLTALTDRSLDAVRNHRGLDDPRYRHQ